MIAFAAVDLRGGRVVQLVGGEPAHERVSLDDPPAVARGWIDAGFAALHVVDLDAALGTGSNAEAITAVADAAGDATLQVGGGIRSTGQAQAVFDAGADRIVVGTRALRDRSWLEELANRWPDRVVVAADVLGDEVVISGWTESSGIAAETYLGSLADLPLAAVLVTDVSREGRMVGADTGRFERLVRGSPHPLLASGGIADAADLAALARAGAAGAVLGMALYTGAVDPCAVARDYGS